jgi:hypothetical protein
MGETPMLPKRAVREPPLPETATVFLPLHEHAHFIRKWYPDHKGFLELSVGLTESKNFLHKNYFFQKHHAQIIRCGESGSGTGTGAGIGIERSKGDFPTQIWQKWFCNLDFKK